MLTDARIATLYLRKLKNARERGLEFDLTLMGFRNLCKAKKCFFSGVTLQFDTRESGAVVRFDVFTVDRKDSSLGYVNGNVVACCHGANELKNIYESGHGLNFKQMYATLTKVKKLGLHKAREKTLSLEVVVPTGCVPFKGHSPDDLTGKKVGKFTIVGYKGESNWLIRCTCGNMRLSRTLSIRNSDSNIVCANCD